MIPLFFGKSDLVPCAFVWETIKTMDFPTIVVYDMVDAVN